MSEQLLIRVKDKISPFELSNNLTSIGYRRVPLIDSAGEFSLRGNLLDIWLERYKLPVRVDLIGDKIENLYLFNPLLGSKIRDLKNLLVLPIGSLPLRELKWAKKEVEAGQYERLFLSEIKKGDLVVHINHGIGRFVGVIANGVKQSPAAEVATSPSAPRNDMLLKVEYGRGGVLTVPVNQIDRLTKYIGSGKKPPLNTLGTASWERTKRKVSEDISKIAEELLRLYSFREKVKRAAYPEDTIWQKQLEDSFEFEPTDDQIKALEEIKKDLASDKPMDRILVGDVGFGKTEVALRTAFKVAQENRQVAVLAPTTVLVEQLFEVFKSRLNDFPVKITRLSRFVSTEEIKSEKLKIKNGEIDIIIGTHRLLSKDMEFKNLGLVVIDEEHRFGVKQKETLKQKRLEVDVLSMSATPIPRSLSMAFSKIRDISVLHTPPVGRKPVETKISEFDYELVKKAIEREINRGGQVFYLHNRVASIAGTASRIQQLVPTAKVTFAHGQMEKSLEKTMDLFMEGEFNVLVSTTIIASGLDLPNVNTIIITDSQKFGLADLYQLRGRVGRGARDAYAYLLYPKGFLPTGPSLERLLAIAESTELGSGFKLAERDLEIRGAGNLLGKEQSGNISLVGFELYSQLLAQAVQKLR